jgi:cysteine desulfurase
VKKIYLDHAATTPMDPRVLEAMTPYFSETFGNPSSLHSAGQAARQAVDGARRSIAGFVGASPRELIFTSGGTESDNLALFGVAHAYKDQGKHVIVSAIEHEAILEPVRTLEKAGFKVAIVGADQDGIIKLDELEKALTPETIFISLMLANNEVGTIQPISKAAQLVRRHKKALGRGPTQPPFLHTDACQAAGVLSLNVRDLGVDLLTLNGSKIYGPKGIGLLYVREGIKLEPQVCGGGHEHGRRSGTLNVPGIIGLAKALELAQAERENENKRLTCMRDKFIEKALELLPDIQLTGHTSDRLPNNISFMIKGVESEILLMRLDMEGIYASAGSACTAGNAEPSHVLLAMGFSKQEARTAVRFSLGHSTTEEELENVENMFIDAVKDIRSESGVY